MSKLNNGIKEVLSPFTYEDLRQFKLAVERIAELEEQASNLDLLNYVGFINIVNHSKGEQSLKELRKKLGDLEFMGDKLKSKTIKPSDIMGHLKTRERAFEYLYREIGNISLSIITGGYINYVNIGKYELYLRNAIKASKEASKEPM